MKASSLRLVRSLGFTAALCSALAISSCASGRVHDGRFPFSMMEKPPTRLKPARGKYVSTKGPAAMAVVQYHDAAEGPPTAAMLATLRPGDVVAFHMSHEEAWSAMRRTGVQKLPYELFRYGHIGLVVPDPGKKRPDGKPHLLQVAMKQAVNAKDDLGYLNDKSWTVYRPPYGSVDVARLHEFTRKVIETAGDPKEAYDYSGALGISNAPWQPDRLEDIGKEYSCATLVVAGLHYAGYDLDAVHRHGWLDVVTPRQVVESYGSR